MIKNGYWEMFRAFGVPVRAHWSLPLVFVMFSGFRFAPGAWLGIGLLILIHEAGHAILCRRYGLRVLAIEMTGYGGLCRHQPARSVRRESIIAWGGVLAQAIVLLLALFSQWTNTFPATPFFWDLNKAFITSNAILIAINLLPFPPLDGHAAWKLFSKKAATQKQGERSKRGGSPKGTGRKKSKRQQHNPLRAAPRDLSGKEKTHISDQVRRAIQRGIREED